jgi:hypothetical protein
VEGLFENGGTMPERNATQSNDDLAARSFSNSKTQMSPAQGYAMTILFLGPVAAFLDIF